MALLNNYETVLVTSETTLALIWRQDILNFDNAANINTVPSPRNRVRIRFSLNRCESPNSSVSNGIKFIYLNKQLTK